MKSPALWLPLLAAAIVAASVGVARFGPVSSAFQQFVSPGPLSGGHAYLGDRCTTCHEPAIGVTAAKCTPCHANAERLLGRQPTAFHASVQECTPCHLEHQGTSVRPAMMDHVALAKLGGRTLADAAARGDRDSAATLTSLETWLRVRTPEQLDESSAREALNCAGCHNRRDPHLKRFGSDCGQCHRLESWKVFGYQHPSPQSKECVQCHEPPPSHRMEHFSMISQKFARKESATVEQCFECHNTTSWNDIVGVGFYKHH